MFYFSSIGQTEQFNRDIKHTPIIFFAYLCKQKRFIRKKEQRESVNSPSYNEAKK